MSFLTLEKKPSYEDPPDDALILVRRPGGYDVIKGENFQFVARPLVSWWAILPPLGETHEN